MSEASESIHKGEESQNDLMRDSQTNDSPDERTMAERLHPIEPYQSTWRAWVRAVIRKSFTRPFVKSLVRARVDGSENIEGLTGAFIMIPNHSSHLDAPMVFSLLPSTLTKYLATGAAADYFYRKKFISFLTSLFFNTYPIERKGNRGGKAKGMTGRLLRAGVPILVFPEGTRTRDGSLGPFKPGAAALASHTGVPLIPIAMTGGHEVMPVGSFFPHVGGKVALHIGAPLYAREGEEPSDFMDRARAYIKAMCEVDEALPPDNFM